MRFLQVGQTTINLEAIGKIQWNFSGHEGTAMITFIGGDFHWVKEIEQAEKLRLATTSHNCRETAATHADFLGG